MTKKSNSVILGLISGIVLPLIFLFVFYLFEYNHYSFKYFMEIIIGGKLLMKIISLCAIPNLILFYFFMRRNLIYSARGVIVATLLFAIFSVLFNVL